MRDALVMGMLLAEEPVVRDLRSTGLSGLGNAAAVAKVVALSSAKLAWKYVPGIAMSLLYATRAAVRYEDEGMRMWVMVRSDDDGYAEAYAAFGALAGLLAAWNTVKGCSRSSSSRVRCSPGGVRGIGIVRAPDVPWEDVERMDNSKGPPEVGFFDVSDEPVYEGYAEAEAVVTGIGALDVSSLKEVAAAAARSAWEVLPLVHRNELTRVNVEAVDEGDRLRILVETVNRGRTGSAMEAVFGAGAAAVQAWALAGHAEGFSIALLSSVKAPLPERPWRSSPLL